MPWEETENYVRSGHEDPEKFDKDSLRTIEIDAAKCIKETGTGLGLPIIQQILFLYGGTIEIDSTPGEGSSFRFALPQTAP